MLLSFRFANHRSFRDEQQLNLTPVYGSIDDSSASGAAVTVAGIFGANASGKSNALHALSFMRQLAIRSDREVEPGLRGLSRHPFRLENAAASEPSRYVVDLTIKDVPHTYGFTIDDEQVLEEWLYYYPRKKKRNVFERQPNGFDWGDASWATFKWGEHELEKIASITSPAALFLSTAARFSQRRPPAGAQTEDPLREVYRWFFKFRSHSRSVLRRRMVEGIWPDSEGDQAVVIALLKAADLGITDVQLKSLAQEALFPDDTELEIESDAISIRRTRDLFRRRGMQRLQFSHRGPEGDVVFELADESTGTQQLLELAIDAAIILRTKGTMTVDEIDASLHPMLTAKLIALFQDLRTNPLKSQLIFTSHDSALLGNFEAQEVLHRDQIWFTEKDNQGSSTLYPLSDFKPRREGENRQKRYLNGNYGAVPDLSADLFEQALLARGEFDVAEAE